MKKIATAAGKKRLGRQGGGAVPSALRVEKKSGLMAGRAVGRAINPHRPVYFYFDGKKYQGVEGDSVASALWANGQSFFAGSLRYHRPRGMTGNVFTETDGFVAIGDPRDRSYEPAVAMASLPISPDLSLTPTRHPDVFSSPPFFSTTKEALNRSRFHKTAGDLTIRGILAPFGMMGSYFPKGWGGRLGGQVGHQLDGQGGFGFWSGLLRRTMGYGVAPKVNTSFDSGGAPPMVQYDTQQRVVDLLVVGGGRSTGFFLKQLLENKTAQISVAVVSQSVLKPTTLPAAMGFDKRLTWLSESVAVKATRIPAGDKTDDKVGDDIIEVVAIERIAMPFDAARHDGRRGKNKQHRQGQTDSLLWRERHHVFHARALVLATGASEQPLPFDNNDLPGVMGFQNAVQLLSDYAVKPGHHAAVITNNDSVYSDLEFLQKNGVALSAVIDIRPQVPKAMLDIAERLAVAVYPGYYPERARSLGKANMQHFLPRVLGKTLNMVERVVKGDDPRVVSVVARARNPKDGDAHLGHDLGNDVSTRANSNHQQEQHDVDDAYNPKPRRDDKTFNSDCLLVSGGFQPILRLLTPLWQGAESDNLIWSDTLQALLPRYWPRQVFLVGAAGGCFDPTASAAMADDVAGMVINFLRGRMAADALAGQERDHYHCGHAIWPYINLPALQQLGVNSFIDQQYDVKWEHIAGAHHLGYRTPLAIKHYSKLGAGHDRGQTGLVMSLAYIYGRQRQEKMAGKTAVSDGAEDNIFAHKGAVFGELHGFGQAVTFGAYAHVPPSSFASRSTACMMGRETPLHGLVARPQEHGVMFFPDNNISNNHGAVFNESHGWQVPHYYPYHQGDESQRAVAEEKEKIIKLRSVGFVDQSALVKIMLVGVDARPLLDELSPYDLRQATAGPLLLLQPRDGRVMARARFFIIDEQRIMVTLAAANGAQVLAMVRGVAQKYGYKVYVGDDSEQWGLLRLVGRGVGRLMMRLMDSEQEAKWNATSDKTVVKATTLDVVESTCHHWLVKTLPRHGVRAWSLGDTPLLVARRLGAPPSFAGGMVDDVEILCAANRLTPLYQYLWQQASDGGSGFTPFALGAGALDYWRLITGQAMTALLGEVDGQHSLYDLRQEEKIRRGKFVGKDLALTPALRHKNRARLVGFIPCDGRALFQAGAVVQEPDKEPLSQGHGVGHITTSSYCPLRKSVIAMGFVGALANMGSEPFGQEVMIADPLFKRYHLAVVVPYDQLALIKK